MAVRNMSFLPSRRAATRRAGRIAGAIAMLVLSGASSLLAAPTLPEIRISPRNTVPACVTPERLMAFLKTRNGKLDPRFRNIAAFYKKHGEAWGVRWDYAFFQMAIETNFLTYRAPSGRMGDVDPKQNNFAGIGTTGGGVPGDSFPDVSTGVLGQIQHLVVYSGEMIPNPVAPRTRLKQEHILAHSLKLNRPVRFSDLARRWAADPKYASSIEWVAERFRADYCKGRGGPAQETEMLPWQQKPARKAEAAPAPKVFAQADASSPVRTVWSREQQRAASKKAARPSPPAVAATGKAADVSPPQPAKAAPEVAKVAVVPVQPVPQPVADAAPVAPAQTPVPANEPDVRFALFTPPPGLAEAKIPQATDRIVPPLAVEASEEPKPQASAVAAEPPAAPVASGTTYGPPEAPVAVAGASVGGFLVAGGDNKDTAKQAFPPPSGLGVKPGRCVVETARYGGETTVLVKAPEGADVHYVALSVLDGFEESMTKTFLASRSEGGEVVGTFPSRDAALVKARTLCPE